MIFADNQTQKSHASWHTSSEDILHFICMLITMYTVDSETRTDTHSCVDRIVTAHTIPSFSRVLCVSHTYFTWGSLFSFYFPYFHLYGMNTFFLPFSVLLRYLFIFQYGLNRLLHIWLLLCLSLSALCAMLCWGPATFLLLCKVLFCCWFSWG